MKTDLLVTIAPPIGQPAGTAIIKFRDSDVEEQPLLTRLRTLYGMTDKEAAVAVELSKDRTLAEITQARGAPPNTIKTQLDERPPPASRRVFKGFASVGQAAQSLARST